MLNLVNVVDNAFQKDLKIWDYQRSALKKNDMHTKVIKDYSNILLKESRLVEHTEQQEQNSRNFYAQHNFSSKSGDSPIDIRWMGQ